MVRVRQRFATPKEPDVIGATHHALKKLDLARVIRPGDSVALTAGSRGIANIVDVLRETTSHLCALGARPFLVPAMGSHGGATAAGQTAVLESYGITESAIGAPIRSSMEVVEIGVNAFGVPVLMDKEASKADHVGVVGRIKPHTGFSGALESGLCKMMMIGLGKHAGAQIAHNALLRCPWEPYLRSVVDLLLARANIRFGVAIVENADDETARIEAAMAANIVSMEERLLELARAWMPRLPFDHADLLIIDEMGKEISGSGIDTNVVGRKGLGSRQATPERQIRRILVRRLSAKTHGNAAGIGHVDFVTDALIEKMDYAATVLNCLTSSYPEGAAIPVHLPTDRATIDAAIASTGIADPARARIQRIKNTLRLTESIVSATYDFSEAGAELEVLGPAPLLFSDRGDLIDGW
jgi:hypothetical protein